MKRALAGWTVALALTGAVAQTTQQQNQQTPGAQTQARASQPATGDNAVLLGMQALAMSNYFEIASSQAAIAKGVRPQVREFAQMMIADHTRNQQQLEQLAGRLGAALPPDEGVNNRLRILALEPLSGAAFERAYLRAQVDGHESTVQFLETAIRALGQTQQGQGGQNQQQGQGGNAGQNQQGQGNTGGQTQQGQGGASSQSPTTGGQTTNPSQPGQGGTTGQGGATQGQGGAAGQTQQNQQGQGGPAGTTCQAQGVAPATLRSLNAQEIAQVRQFMQQTLSSVRRHLQMANQLYRSVQQ